MNRKIIRIQNYEAVYVAQPPGLDIRWVNNIRSGLTDVFLCVLFYNSRNMV